MYQNSDCIYRIGSSHRVCEDFAMASGSQRGPIRAILSDGCSICLDADGKQIPASTGVGAAVLALTADNLLCSFSHGKLDASYLLEVAHSSLNTIFRLNLNRNSLSATLLLSRIAGNYLEYCIVGDGVYAFRHRESQEWTVDSISYGEAPYYLRYEISNDKNSYLNGSKYVEAVVTKHVFASDPSNDQQWRETNVFSNECIPALRGVKPIDSFDMLVMFSDGVQSFVKTDPETGKSVSVPLEESIRPFLDFKNYRGEFVYRRASRALSELARKGIHHTDDFSMTGIFSESPDA